MAQTQLVSSPYRRILLISIAAIAALVASAAVAAAPLVETSLAQTGGLGGTVTYFGALPGPLTIQISVYTTTAQPLPAPIDTAQTTSDSGGYGLQGIPSGSYYVFAYLDSNASSALDPGAEPFAWYDYGGDGKPDPVTVLEGTTGGIDLLLTDLWQPLGGPLGQVNSIVARPDGAGTAYAAVGKPYGGGDTAVYRTTDAALSWRKVYSSTDAKLNSLAISGTVIYAAGQTGAEKGIALRTLDGSAGWKQVFTDTTGDIRAFRDVALNTKQLDTVFLAGAEQGPTTAWVRQGVVYRTNDNALTWTPVLTVPEGDLFAVTVDPVTPTTVFAGGYLENSGTRYAAVYRSGNNGATWSPVLTDTYGAEQQITALAVHPVTPTIVYAGSQTSKAVYRSSDGGLSWTRVITDRGFRIAVDPPATVYAADDWRELARSSDLGATWVRRVGGQLAPDVIQAIATDRASPAQDIYLGTRTSGPYVSDDGGESWTQRIEGIDATVAPRIIALDPQNEERAFIAADCDGVWRTEDGGGTWERRLAACARTVAQHPLNSSVVLVGIDASPSRAIVRSTDGGATFLDVYTGTADIEAIAIAPSDTDVTLAAGTDSAAAVVLKSSDGGTSWQEVLSTANASATALAFSPADERVALVGISAQGGGGSAAIYRTTDGGSTWTLVYAGGAGQIHTIVVDRQVPQNVYATDDQSVLKSVDGGATWLPPVLSYAEANRNLLAADPRLADHLYLAGPGYVAETIDGGQTWSDWTAPINQGTEGRSATALAVSEGGITQTLYAGFSGVWSYTRPSPQNSDFTTERVLGGLSQPTAIDWAPNGDMFIAHQDGRVLVYAEGALTQFIDLSDEVNNNWNRGLIGIEIHPDFPDQPYVYLLYTYDPPELPGLAGAVDGPDGNGARVSRLVRIEADSANSRVRQAYRSALPASRTVILGKNSTIDTLGDPADAGGELAADPACTELDGSPTVDCLPSEGPSHTVGWLEFGHDGNLWVTNGEGAPYINPDVRAARAQDWDSLGGKLLRIDPVTGEGVPGNPYYDPATPGSNRSRVWASGLRNPFRFALDPVSDTPYLGDVGWYSWEELNVGGPGANFGWPCYEGGASGNVRHSLYEGYAGTADVCQPLYEGEPGNGIDAPRYSYQNVAGAAIVVGDIYTGTRYPSSYQGALFIADYDKRWIKYLRLDQNGSTMAQDFLEDVSALGGPVQLTLGPDGYLYYVALNPDPSGESEIRRVRYTSAPSVEVSATPAYGLAPLTVAFTRTLTSDTGTLSHRWSFGDGALSSAVAPTHTYIANGAYTAILTVTTPQGRSSSGAVDIVVGEEPPHATIAVPAAGSTYVMGTQLAFSGSATDTVDGDIAAVDLQWNARLFFNGHFHPDFFKQSAVASGNIGVPYHNDNTSLYVCLTASDSAGLEDTACVELQPRTAPYAFLSDPTGAQLTYDGKAYTTPFTIAMMVNAPRTIGAPMTYQGLPFATWSDGGAAIHTITGKATPQFLTARYGIRSWLPLVLKGGP